MTKKSTSISSKEVIFQVVLHIVVFIFYSFDKHEPHIQSYQIAFFLNYAFAALVINYCLLPYFFYSKKQLSFFLLLFLTLAFTIVMEEMVVEKIYFPDTKGKHFANVFYTLLDVLPVLTILSGFKFAWDAAKKQKEVEVLKTIVRESELQFLKTQINPHFLFNNLNNLYAYAIENSPKTPDIILKLSAVLRYMLYECKENYVPLEKEVKQLENFVKLSEMQIEERGSVHFATQNIQPGYQIAPLILVVFIENAFKHSTASQSDGILIEVAVELLENNTLKFICKNSFSDQSNTDSLSQGIGLQNVQKRLQLLYPNAHDLNIKKSANQYEVRLSLQLNTTIAS